MRRVRIPFILAAMLLLSGQASGENLYAELYDPQELTRLQAIYSRGWLDNFNNVFLPAMTPEERAGIEAAGLEMELSLPEWEPFGFYSDSRSVTVSAASLKFLDDLSVATAWLDLNNYTLQTISDYLLMLRTRHLRGDMSPPPKPLAALCIPNDALSDSRVNERANRIFDSIVVFVLLHEYGHVFHRHPGNLAVAPEVSRANEEAADRFALDLLARVGEVPLGVTVFFSVAAQLAENRADYWTDAAFERALATRTHPLSPARLQSFARHLTGSAQSYAKGFRANGQLEALSVSLQISQFALLLADPDIQRLSAKIGQTVETADLAPRRKGQNLAPPCDSRPSNGLLFDGNFHGTVMSGTTPFDVDAFLTQDRDQVSGSYSFGAGFARIEGGEVTGNRLTYRWTLPPDSGQGVITVENGAYNGTWGVGQATSGGGEFSLSRGR